MRNAKNTRNAMNFAAFRVGVDVYATRNTEFRLRDERFRADLHDLRSVCEFFAQNVDTFDESDGERDGGRDGGRVKRIRRGVGGEGLAFYGR